MSHSLATKNDEAMKCRIFIGNLPNEMVSKDLIKNMFGQYGSYVDCSIYKNYGFVQFDDEQSATNAVSGTNGTVMFDRRLDVKIAANGRKDKGIQQNGVGKTRIRNMNPRDVRPLMSKLPYDPNLQYPPHMPPIQPTPYGYPQSGPPMTAYPMNPNQPMPSYAPPQQMAPPRQPLSTPTPQQSAITQPHASNDSNSSRYCEIVCSSKKQQGYAEFIEFTMNKLGFVCNINILGDNYPSEVVLNRACHDGIPVAVSLKDDNEDHRSINLHIFSGNPEEHRNMPLDVAEQFMKKRFNFNSVNTTAPTANSVNPNAKSFVYSTQPPPNNQNQQSSGMNVTDIKGTDKISASTGIPNLANSGYPYPGMYTNSPYHGNFRPGIPAPEPYYHGLQAAQSYPMGVQSPYPQMSAYMPPNAPTKR